MSAMANIWKIATTGLMKPALHEKYLNAIAVTGFVGVYGDYDYTLEEMSDWTARDSYMLINVGDILLIYKGGHIGRNTIYRIGTVTKHTRDGQNDLQDDGCHYIIRRGASKDLFDGAARYRLDVTLWVGKEYQDIPLQHYLPSRILAMAEKHLNYIEIETVRNKLLKLLTTSTD